MADQEFLLELTESYLKSVFCDTANISEIDLDVFTSFRELGIDSFYVLKIVKKLESDFGTLPKTLLFENFNIHDLTNYFFNKHQITLQTIFSNEINRKGSAFSGSAYEIKEELVDDLHLHSVFPAIKEPIVPVKETVQGSMAAPVLILEADAHRHPELGAAVRKIFDRYKNEGSVSRGTRNIAPNLFIGSERKGYFNYSRCKNIILAYAYTGPREYFVTLTQEIVNHCDKNGLELNIFAVEQLHAAGDIPFYATPFGVFQQILDIENFNLDGKKMRRLRYQVGKFEKNGSCSTLEYKCGSNPETDQAIAGIIDQWCSARTMVNPLIHIVKEEILSGTLNNQHRLFLTYIDTELQNVILISRMSEGEGSYLMDLEFYPPTMPLGGLEFAIVKIIETLVAEGCNMLSLGGTYGCKLNPSPNANPEVDKILDDLRMQNIFNDEGNLQFKNKFRPDNRTIYLCQPVGKSNPDNVVDIIMMIADPAKMQTSDEEFHSFPKTLAQPSSLSSERVSSVAPLTISAYPHAPESTSFKLLKEAGFNPMNVPADKVRFDLKTDSWAQLSMPAIEHRVKSLFSNLQRPVNLDESLRSIFPFRFFALAQSGRTAEKALCRAWRNKGKVIQNLLFPTWIVSQIEEGFTPVELPHPRVFQLKSDEIFRSDLAWEAFETEVMGNPSAIAFVCLEINNNAAGGFPIGIDHLRQVKSLLTKQAIPLVIDATRILENALWLMDHEKQFSELSVWQVVNEILAYADVVTVSLAKDFCFNKGGLIATNDAELFHRIQECVQEDGVGLDVIDKKLVAQAMQSKKYIETQVRQRIEAVEKIGNSLKQKDVPIVEPVGRHCILIDVKQITEFQGFSCPVASFLAWLFINTGIRAGEHNVGMQTNTSLNGLVRLAIPVGLEPALVDELITQLHIAFDRKRDIPELVTEEGVASFGDIYARYILKQYHFPSEIDVAENYQPRNTASKEAPSIAVSAVLSAGLSEKDLTTTASGSNEASSQLQAFVNPPASHPEKLHKSMDIAVVGMAGRYPKAGNMDEMWENLRKGRDCIDDLPKARKAQRQQATFDRTYRGGFLDDIDKFDSLFFNISPREAEVLDPQERLFLEVAWEALEDAGYYPEMLAPRNIGVYVGAVWTMYQMLGVEQKLNGNTVNPNSFLWSIANRVSYWMNLTGPSLTVDTACSSSLTAIYLACEAIKKGDCCGAIVGGVNLDLHQHKFDINWAGGALSNDGVCRSFGAGANGYVAGEGVGAIYLKPLEQAITDKDNIYGVIKSIAVNHGGKTSGYTVPNPKAQSALIAAALEESQIDARSIGYIEAHGTGTELGDPIEISGLTAAFDAFHVAAHSCPIGSIKTNIGHLEAAAGIVGVCKVLLQMKHRQIVPSLHSSELNEFIDFRNSPFYVEQSLEDWQEKHIDGITYPLRAGVSSFGAGGANAHLILEDYVPSDSNTAEPDDSIELVFPLSARNDEQLREMAQRLKSHLEKLSLDNRPPCLNNIAFTLQNGRKSFDSRVVVIARKASELIEKVGCFINDKKDADVILGHVKNSEGLTRLLSRKEKEAFINLLYKNRDPHQLAQLWIDGVLSDWQGFPLQRTGRRVSLPTYPFADKRHWIAAGSDREHVSGNKHFSEAGMRVHPLIDSNESTFQRQLFKKTFHHQEFFIQDHVVSGIATLPGVAYLEQVRIAGEIATGRKVQKIKNILWVSPLTVENSTIEVFIELKPNGDSVNFEVFSESEGGRKNLYSQGRLLYFIDQSIDAEPEYLDIPGIHTRCSKVIDGEEAYPLFKAAGLDYGPSFQVLQEVFKGEDEILGLLKLPVVRAEDFEAFQLHPSILDASMQAGVAGQLKQAAGNMIVPYSIGEVEFLQPLTRTCYSYVTRIHDDKKTTTQLSRENITITDEDGRILVRIKDSVGVPLADVHEKPKQQATIQANANINLPTEESYKRLYYSHHWEESSFEADRSSATNSLLIFDVDDTLRNAYVVEKSKEHHSQVTAVLVKPGNEFLQLDENTFQVNPRDRQQFLQLFSALEKAGKAIESICYAWADKKIPTNGDALRDALQLGPHAFLFFCQSLIEQKLQHIVRIAYLFDTHGGDIQPHHDAMNGFIKTLHLENPKIYAKTLGVDVVGNEVTNIVNALLTELHPDTQATDAARYQGLNRYVRKLKKVEVDSDHATRPTGLKEGGVYLITGGAGGLGLLFAEFLISTCKAKLLLTGRSDISAELEDKMNAWRRQGADAIYISADVSRPDDAHHLVDAAKARFGQINGVIHSAGVLRDSYIRNKTLEDMQAVCAPKVLGTFYLDEATRDEDLDFFVTFSSLAAVGGNAGQCDYAYANHYMDSFASRREQQRSRGERVGKSLSLNWSLWADGGMRLDEQTEIFFRKNLGITPLSKEAGLEAFVKSLSLNTAHLAVLEGVQEKIEQAWGIKEKDIPLSRAAALSTNSIESISGDDEQLANLLKQGLRQLVMDMLKLDAADFSGDSVLLDLGFDSIGLSTFANAINDKYGLDINPVLFFEYPSVNTIAEHLSVEYREAVSKVHRPNVVNQTPVAAIPPMQEVTSPGAPHSNFSIDKAWNPPSQDQDGNPSTIAGRRLSPEHRFINEPIAIVGIAGVMPQSATLQEFWDNLKNARNMVTDIPRDRWVWEEHHGDPVKEVNKSNSRWGGFMKEVDKFDPFFFGIIPREAEMMDPQQRIFLETVWHAIEDSGHKVSDLSGTKTGLFVGVSAKDYIDVLAEQQMALDGFSASGNSHSILANRVSFLLNLRGPSAPLDTACSSSLVALHRAIESIHTGSSDMAIVGGVQVMLTPVAHISLSSAGMLSVDGMCKTFDKDANGYVRGEGSGAIFIKPLAKAEADGNPIYAVIKATAENHGGKVTMLTAPNPNAQAELLLEAYQKAQIDPATVGYIECHGTGTSLGDPIEIQALKRSFAELYKKHNKTPPQVPHCGLSSVKTNIGHLEPAAGIASLLKVLLAMKHKYIPALLHFNELNPYIDLTNSPLYIVDKTRPWEAIKDENGKSLPLRAGVSSFGWGGANAHIVLEEYIPPSRQFALQKSGPFPVVLSARSDDRLKNYAKSLLSHLQQHELQLADVAYTLLVGRDVMEERLGVVVDSMDQLKEKLRSYIKSDQISKEFFRGRVSRYQRNEQGLSTIGEDTKKIQRHHIEQWLEEDNLEKLLGAWMEGADVAWVNLRCFAHQNAFSPRRVSLPGYPFARERYWVDNTSPKKNTKMAATNTILHPLLHNNISILNQVRFSSVFTGKEVFLLPRPSGHQNATLSPMAYLEMAREAVVQATATYATAESLVAMELRNIEWGALHTAVAGKPIVTTVFKHIEPIIGYQIHSIGSNDEGIQETVMHCCGEALAISAGESPRLDIQQLKVQMWHGALQQNSLDKLMSDLTAQQENSLKGIQAIYEGHEQLLVELHVLDVKPASEFILPPAIMDGCLQASALLIKHRSETSSEISQIVPTHLKTIKVLSRCTEKMYAWVRLARGSRLLDNTIKLDIDLMDQQGSICVRLKSLTFNNQRIRDEGESAPGNRQFEQLLDVVYVDGVADTAGEDKVSNGEFEKILEEIF